MSGRRGAMVSKSQSLLDLLLAHNRTLSLLLTSDVASAEMVAAANEDLLYQLGERNDTFWLEAMSSTSSSSSSSIPNTTSLEMMLGPVRDSYPTVILMTIVYVLILLTGVTGNVITCLVIAKKRYMHTATNYYLFSLAVSDLLLLVLGLPQDLVLVWQRYPYAFGESFCILRGLTSELSTNASILTITAFTIERYVAICHPLRSHTTLKLARVVKTIVVIWVIGALSAAPIAYQFGIIRVSGIASRLSTSLPCNFSIIQNQFLSDKSYFDLLSLFPPPFSFSLPFSFPLCPLLFLFLLSVDFFSTN